MPMDAQTTTAASPAPALPPGRFTRIRATARLLFPYAVTALYLAGLLLVMARHEMWRDEHQAWLLARDSATPWALLENMRYDGHPGLWHILLWFLTCFTSNPAAMQGLHAAIAAGTVFLIMRFAPFHVVTRLLLCGGYFFAYEWAVISRNYAISAFLFLAVAALHRRRWVWFPAQAGLLCLLCHTNIMSIILVLVLTPVLAVEYAVSYAGGYRDARRVLGRCVAGFLLVIAGLYTGIGQVQPPPDNGYAPDWKWQWNANQATNTADCLISAYLPRPEDKLNFWNKTDIINTMPREKHMNLALLILGAGCLFFLTQPWPIIPYLAGSTGILLFFYAKFGAAHCLQRHNGFLFLLPIVLLWMSWDYRRWRLPWRRADAPFGFWNRYRDIVLWPLLALHVAGTAVAVKWDWQASFSESKAAARWLRDTYGTGPGRVFIGDTSYMASSVISYMELDRMYYPGPKRYGSYVIWDRSWRASRQYDPGILAQARANTNAVVLVLDRPWAGGKSIVSEKSRVAAFTNPAVAGENYYIYYIPSPAETLSTNAPAKLPP